MGEPMGTSVMVKIPRAWIVDPHADNDYFNHSMTWITDADGDYDERLLAAVSAVKGMHEYLAGWTDEVEDVEGEPDAVIVNVAGEANYGLACEDLHLDAFVDMGIPFYAHDEPNYEFDGTIRMFTPEYGDASQQGNADGDPLLNQRDIERCIATAKGKAHGTTANFGDVLVEELRSLFGDVDIDRFYAANISHLHAITPKTVS